ncbi:MAG: hypothetical protein ACJAR9_000234 [Celeribacter sp.]|jgi:hypothetical protein
MTLEDSRKVDITLVQIAKNALAASRVKICVVFDHIRFGL